MNSSGSVALTGRANVTFIRTVNPTPLVAKRPDQPEFLIKYRYDDRRMQFIVSNFKLFCSVQIIIHGTPRGRYERRALIRMDSKSPFESNYISMVTANETVSVIGELPNCSSRLNHRYDRIRVRLTCVIIALR